DRREAPRALERADPRRGVEGVRWPGLAPGGAARTAEDLGGRLVERVVPAGIAEHVPHRGPPAARLERSGDRGEGGVLVQPVKRRGAEAEIEGRVVERAVLERLRADVRGGTAHPQERGEPWIGLDREQRTGAARQQRARGDPRSGADLERDRARPERA